MRLPVAVIVELVVGGESDEASPRSRQREKDLSGCIFPHLTEEDRLKTKDMDNRLMLGGYLGTFASFSFSHFGVIKYKMPSKAPGRVTPLNNKMISTT